MISRVAIRVMTAVGLLSLSPRTEAQAVDRVEDNAPSEMLDLVEAIAIAVRRAPAVNATLAQQRAAAAQRTSATLGYAPDVIVGGAYTDGFPGSGSNLQLRGMLSSPFFRHYAAGVDASWNLVDLLRAPHAVKAADSRQAIADAQRAAAQRDVALMVVAFFERVLIAQGARALLVAEVDARRGQVSALRSRVEAGAVAGEQLLQAEAGLLDVEADLAGAGVDERSARSALRVLLGDARALTMELEMTVSPAVSPHDVAPFPETRAAQAWRQNAEHVKALADLDWLPRVVVGASAGYANPPPGVDPGYYALGLGISLPLTGVLRDRARRAEIVADTEARAADQDAVAEALSLRVAEIDGAVAGLEALLPAAAASARAAQLALDATSTRVEAGVAAQVALETARALQRRAAMREHMLGIQLNGLRARRALLVSR